MGLKANRGALCLEMCGAEIGGRRGAIGEDAGKVVALKVGDSVVDRFQYAKGGVGLRQPYPGRSARQVQ